MIAALQSAMGRRGNDDQLARIDGGSGLDTLALIGANLTLDLTLMANPAAGVPHGGSRLSGIDIIDLTGTGDNKLVLTARDVLDLADFNVFAATGRRQLLVRGDVGDLIELPDLGWLQAGTATIGGSDCVVWNHNDSLATLYVAQDVFRLLSAEVLPPFGLV